MRFDLTGRRTATLAALLLVSAGLSACTTTEGTNAFSDPATFEREVMDSTAQGLGLIPAPVKPDPTNPRGPLVLPKDTTGAAAADHRHRRRRDAAGRFRPGRRSTPPASATADIERLRHVRVVDVNTPDGRPLTQAELKTMTAKMKGFTLNSKRSIFTPPEQYFTLSGGQQDLVCLAKGELVSVNDPTCPPEIRKALLKKRAERRSLHSS